MSLRVAEGFADELKQIAAERRMAMGLVVEQAVRGWVGTSPSSKPQTSEKSSVSAFTDEPQTEFVTVQRSFFELSLHERVAFLCMQELMPRAQMLELNRRILEEKINEPYALAAAIIDVRGDPSFTATDRAVSRAKYIFQEIERIGEGFVRRDDLAKVDEQNR
jgi:hypothetical protein